MADKSRDLILDKSRCSDTDCPAWKSDCARAEKWKGAGRFNWLPPQQRRKGKPCKRLIDPVTLEEKGASDA